jgi:hypothetical protein
MYKKISLLFLAAFFLLGLKAGAFSEDSLRIAELEKIIAECRDPLKIPSGIFKEIKTLKGVKPRPDFKKIRGITNEGLVHVFVDSTIYLEIGTSLNQFMSDLESETYSVSFTQVGTQTPEEIRSILQSEYSYGLVGAILVGDVPAAWMETPPLAWYTSHFPTDYFYMDLDGSWYDSDGDDFYDSLAGDLEPEIWSGRITPSNCLFGDEVTMLNQYFDKNHAYRTGSLSLPDRALGYLECPWYPQVEIYLGWVYSDVTFFDDENTTTALHYKSMLEMEFEWVHLLAHSSPWGSTFFLEDESYGGGSVFSYEMPPLNPKANFVLLNACSNAKYTETNNLGQSYLFGSDYVLAVIGETRIMYGDAFGELYQGLELEMNLGDAFLDWIWWYYDWYWGCHIFGDPTLKPHGHGSSLRESGFSEGTVYPGTPSWENSPVDVSPFTDGNPAACVDLSGNIWAAWNSGRDVRSNIWTSHYDGVSWSEPEEVAFSVPWDFHPSMVTDLSGNVWIFWQSYREVDNYIDGYDIYGIYNDGSSWSSPIRITTADPYDVEPKSAVDSSGNVWVVWRTERKPDSDIMYSYYNESSWSSPSYLSSSLEEERDPAITVDKDGNVWVVWYARKNDNWDLYAKFYNGVSWSAEIRVTDNPGYDLQPTVTADSSGRVWVLWRSNRDGNLDIYSKYYDGISWSYDMPVTTDSGDDICPSVAYDGENTILATWQSNRDGDWNIYHSRYQGEWLTPAPVSTDQGNQIQPAGFYDGNNHFGSVFPGDQGVNWDIYYSSTIIKWFAPAVNYGTGDGPRSVFCGDLDGDLDLDLAIADNYSESVSILQNHGDGTFYLDSSYLAGDGAWSIFCADLDADSDLDLAVTNCWSNNVSILKNNGDGTFQTKVDYDVPGQPRSVFCADLDGDLDLDLAVGTSNTVSVLKNSGGGTFYLDSSYVGGLYAVSVFCGDLDQDLDLDIAVANYGGHNDVSILKNLGDGIFYIDSSYSTGEGPYSVFCADLDGDSDLDIATANVHSKNVSVLKNNGDGTFQTRTDYDLGNYTNSIFCADLDGDTDLDLAVANRDLYETGNVSIFKNNGNGTFESKVDYGTGVYSIFIFCADLDSDSDLDIAVANLNSNNVSILKNLTQLSGNSPPYPFALLEPVEGDTTLDVVNFDWTNTYDPNLSDQIRYDLYISTCVEFIPDSTIVDSNLVRSDYTDTLDIGKYYWKVKAKDNWGAETWSTQTQSFDALYVDDGLVFEAHSPVDLIVTNPRGDSIGVDFNTILHATYDSTQDLNDDGDKDDLISISRRLVGDYLIQVIGEPEDSGDYDLGIKIGGSELFYLTQNQPSPPPDKPDTFSYHVPWYLTGDVNGDWAIDVVDVVYLINYLFKSGSAPDLDQSGDVNCDHIVDVVDVVYLINYLFKNGPPPC